jgi:hypothetical protein
MQVLIELINHYATVVLFRTSRDYYVMKWIIGQFINKCSILQASEFRFDVSLPDLQRHPIPVE